MKEVVYNCGYAAGIKLHGSKTGKSYVFRKYFVTSVEEGDAEVILQMTANDISWCSRTSKKIPPFMEFEDWFNEVKGSQKARSVSCSPEEYLQKMHL